MGAPCKVCSNPDIKNKVNLMISDGIPDEKIANELCGVGVEISKTGVVRHRINHYIAPENVVTIDASTGDTLIKIEQPPIGDDADKLLETIKNKIDNKEEMYIVKNRMVRETLLSEILESQLAITASALERYRKGVGKYPLDMVKGLSTVGILFEKTVMQTAAQKEISKELLERELVKIEKTLEHESKQRVLNGDIHNPTLPYEYRMNTYFHYGDVFINAEEYNQRMAIAWSKGFNSGKQMNKQRKKDQLNQTVSEIETNL